MATLYKRGTIWYSSLRVDGRRVRKALGRDRRQAESKLADLIKRREDKVYGHHPRNIGWWIFKEAYLAYSKNSKEPETHIRDKSALASLERFYPITKVNELTPELLEKFKGWRKAAGLHNATVNRDLQALKAMIRKAVAWKYLHHQDFDSVVKFKLSRGAPKYYTQAQSEIILTFPGVWGTISHVGLFTGMRRKEIYWLSWDDVDFQRNLIWVRAKQGFMPKDYENRAIPIHPRLKTHLQGLQRVSKWVLGERPSTLGVMSTYFCKKIRRVHFKGGINWLRHTFASQLALADVNIRKIQLLMGHSDLSTTQIYLELQPSGLDGIVTRLPY